MGEILIFLGGQAMHPFGDNMILYAVRKLGVFMDRFEPKPIIGSNNKSDVFQIEISDSKLFLFSRLIINFFT